MTDRTRRSRTRHSPHDFVARSIRHPPVTALLQIHSIPHSNRPTVSLHLAYVSQFCVLPIPHTGLVRPADEAHGEPKWSAAVGLTTRPRRSYAPQTELADAQADVDPSLGIPLLEQKQVVAAVHVLLSTA